MKIYLLETEKEVAHGIIFTKEYFDESEKEFLDKEIETVKKNKNVYNHTVYFGELLEIKGY